MDIIQDKNRASKGAVFNRTRGVKNKFEYILEDHVALVTMIDGDNLINPDFVQECLDILDIIEKQTDARALVVHSANPKTFSLGVDIEWAVKMLGQNEKDRVRKFFLELNNLFLRILLYPMPTIAAINGHVFGIGVVFGCCFDFRYMRSERGYLCMPEVDLGMPLIPGMLEILKRVIPTTRLEQIQYTGRRYNAQECLEAGFATRVCPGEKLLDEAMAWVKVLDKKRNTIAEMKMRMHSGIVKVIQEQDPQYISKGETIYA
jgi:enoyl-CoA hydratase/carnithine racemase